MKTLVLYSLNKYAPISAYIYLLLGSGFLVLLKEFKNRFRKNLDHFFRIEEKNNNRAGKV